MFNEIKDFAAPELDVYARTSEVQLLRYYEPEPGIFIAESPKVIERALKAGYQPISFLVEHKDLEGEAQEILKQYSDVPVYTAEYELLVKLTGFALTRGMLCAMRRNPLPSVEEICRNASRIAVLENVVNPTNIGAIFRSAAALHMDAVLLTGGCSDPQKGLFTDLIYILFHSSSRWIYLGCPGKIIKAHNRKIFWTLSCFLRFLLYHFI